MRGCVMLLGVCLLAAASRNISAETTILDRLLNLTEYDRAKRPPGIRNPGDPCVVEIDLLFNSVGPVSNLDMELTMSFYLRQEWTDTRLSFEKTDDVVEPITVSVEYMPLIWKPDLFFTLGRESYRHDSTTPNVLLRLWSNGSILYSQRITSTMKCKMDLSKFPHDVQNCRCSMMSYSYDTNDVVFQWSSKRQATLLLPSAYLAEFVLEKLEVADCTETFATGTFTCLESILTLQRQMGFYMTQTYIPSVLIVMLSWAAFWIDHEAVPARISVGLLTVLTITTQSSGARSELPRVSYIKAIDVWMSANLIFVFTAYMEYAVVTIMSRRYKRKLRNYNDPDLPRKDSESMEIEMGMSSSLSFTLPSDLNVSFDKTIDPGTRESSDHHTPRPKSQPNSFNQSFDQIPEGPQTPTETNSENHLHQSKSPNNKPHPLNSTFLNHEHTQKQQQPMGLQLQQRRRYSEAPPKTAKILQNENSTTTTAKSNTSSHTNAAFIGDLISTDAMKKQQKRRQFLWNQKRQKRAKRIYMRNYGRRVDFHSRYLFPCSYVVFNFFYWFYYMSIS